MSTGSCRNNLVESKSNLLLFCILLTFNSLLLQKISVFSSYMSTGTCCHNLAKFLSTLKIIYFFHYRITFVLVRTGKLNDVILKMLKTKNYKQNIRLEMKTDVKHHWNKVPKKTWNKFIAQFKKLIESLSTRKSVTSFWKC